MELTKVYVVLADNCEEYEAYRDWIEGVFTSEESAKKYISDQKSRHDEDMRRINELCDQRRDDGTYDWTAEEHDEYEELWARWAHKAWRTCPHYWIKKFELKS